MPKRKTVKKGGKRKFYRPARRMKRRARQIPSAFPSNKLVRFRYCDSGALTVTSGAMASQKIKANDPYAPITSSQQPTGWSLWATLYDEYVCVGSKITVHFKGYDSTQSTSSIPFMVGVQVGDDTTFPTDYRVAVEQKLGTYGRVHPNGEMGTTSKAWFSAKRFFNIKDIRDNFKTFGAATTSSPSELAYYNLWAQPFDRTDHGHGIVYTFVVEYIVLFGEPKELS